MAARAGKAKITAYVADEIRAGARKQAFDNDLNVSAIIEALLERHLSAAPPDQAPTLARAREISADRRRRSD